MKHNKDKNPGKMIFAIALAVLVLFVAQRVAGETTLTDMGFVNRGIFNLDENFLQQWQETVGDLFCTSVVYGDADCWASTLCDLYEYPDDLESGAGVAMGTDPVTGVMYIAAHIEGERGPPLVVTNATTMVESTYYPYKVSFFVSDIEDDADMTFKIYYSNSLTGYEALGGTFFITDGGSYGAGGTSMITALSKNYYDKVRMTFDPKISASATAVSGIDSLFGGGRGRDIEEITNDIVEIGTAPTTLGEEYEDIGGVGGSSDPQTGPTSGTGAPP